MKKILNDDEVVEALKEFLPEQKIREALSNHGRFIAPEQLFLVERTCLGYNGTTFIQLSVRRQKSRRCGNRRIISERVAELPPIDELKWSQIV